MARNLVEYVVMNAKASTGVGNSVFTFDYRHKDVVMSVAGMGSGDTITIRCQGAFSESAPDFSAAKSASNAWDYIQMIDLNDGSTVDGDTGVTFTNSSDVRLFSINVDGLRWVSFEVATISDTANTSATVKVYLFND